ncbi:MAG: endolytic transglycosylase MltG, partial [Acidobacteria bacterium]|nr:endolytic transglycosylase MltG [Acidobacteriota bacterium]
ASPEQIITRLSRGDTYTRALTFPEGLNIRDMAAIFEKSGMGTATEFVTAANATALIADIDPDAGNLEGYLFPSTYALPRRAGAEGVVRAMVKEFRKALGTEPLPSGMTARELVALASIVEKETAQGSERPVVAGVYANRLRIGMPLQCDPTVIYAMMLNKTWNGNIRKTDLAMDSPYNTYKYAGLPPGPIASPGKGSLDAARHPADVKYLYFVSRNDGTHVFAATLAEHNRNVREFQLNRR